MKFLVRSGWGESLALARRLEAEGNEVRFSVIEPTARDVGNGLIQKTRDFPAAASWADVVVFDSNEFTMPRESERLRSANRLVVGSSHFSATLENDRAAAMQLASDASLNVPEFMDFVGRKAFQQARDFLSGQDEDDGWVWKPNDGSIASTYVSNDVPEMLRMLSYFEHLYATQKGPEKVPFDFILTPKIEGTEVSTEAWFNGSSCYLVNQTLERNRFCNKDLGEKTGCAGNVVWCYGDNESCVLFKELIDPIVPFIKGKYNGPIDVNVMIEKESNAPVFLEFTPRIGYDAIFSLMHLVDDMGSLLYATARGDKWSGRFLTDQFAGAVRVNIPPYPEHEEGRAAGVPVFGFDPSKVRRSISPCEVRLNPQGDVETSGPEGYVFVVSAVGGDVASSIANAENTIKEIKVPLMRYRTDLSDRCTEVYGDLVSSGWVREAGRKVFRFTKDAIEFPDEVTPHE